MGTVACMMGGAMVVGSWAGLVVGVWHALGGMGLWQCWFVLGGGFGTFNLANFWAWVLCGSLWWGPKCHTGPTWVCEPIGALGAMHPWPPGPNLGLGQFLGRGHSRR